MSTLMDRLQEKQSTVGAGAAQVGASGTGPTGAQTLSGLLAAKAGRLDTAPGVSGESLYETQAASDAARQGAAVAQQASAGVQAQQLQQQGQAQQTKQAEQSLALQGKRINQQFDTQKRALQEQARQGQISLATDDAAAKAEALGFSARLSNDQYINRLEQEGARRRLDDAAQFKTELYKSVLGDNLAVLESKLGQSEIMQASGAQFQRDLAKLSMEDFLKMSKYKTASAGASSVATGVGQLGTAGATAYAAKQAKDEATAAAAPPPKKQQGSGR